LAIERSAEALRRLVDDLLDVSRIVSDACGWSVRRSAWRSPSKGALDASGRRPPTAASALKPSSPATTSSSWVTAASPAGHLEHPLERHQVHAIGGVVRVLLRATADRAEWR
jgi:hypothetical protein